MKTTLLLCVAFAVAGAAIAANSRTLLQGCPASGCPTPPPPKSPSPPSPRPPAGCRSRAVAGASAESQSAVAEAITTAIQQCAAPGFENCPCDNIVKVAAQACATAFARAISEVLVQTSGGPQCVATAQAQSNAQATAESLARAYAQAITVSCSGEVAQVEREEISRVLAQAITSAEAAVTQQGAGSTEAAARAVAEDIQVAVAKSVAAAVGKCKCDAEGRPTDEEARAIVGTAAGSEGQQTTDTQARTDVQGELDDFFAGTGTSQAEAQTGRR